MQQRLSRILFFILAIMVGVAAGVSYGWGINPAEEVQTAPHTLRMDYKTDYVLMVAELYQSEGNLSQAIKRLASVGDSKTSELIDEALLFATQHGYSPEDITLMWNLAEALEKNLEGAG